MQLAQVIFDANTEYGMYMNVSSIDTKKVQLALLVRRVSFLQVGLHFSNNRKADSYPARAPSPSPEPEPEPRVVIYFWGPFPAHF